jgi:hypothetical protein
MSCYGFINNNDVMIWIYIIWSKYYFHVFHHHREVMSPEKTSWVWKNVHQILMFGSLLPGVVCLIYISCVCLRIVVPSTYCVVFFALFVLVLCLVLWIVHSLLTILFLWIVHSLLTIRFLLRLLLYFLANA